MRPEESAVKSRRPASTTTVLAVSMSSAPPAMTAIEPSSTGYRPAADASTPAQGEAIVPAR
jgi:hypothetical protein